MASNDVEFDILANGKPATKELNKVNKQIDKLDKNHTETTKKMKMNWTALGASIAGVTVALVALTSKGVEAEKMFIGMDIAVRNNQKSISGNVKFWRTYTEQLSLATGEQEQFIASLATTAINSGLTAREVDNVLQTAIGLGRAFPNESIEEFANNMIIMNTTGENQAFIVDILETRYRDMEIQTRSTAEQMAMLTGIANDANTAYQDESVVKYTNLMNKFGRALEKVGTVLVEFLDNIGLLDMILGDSSRAVINVTKSVSDLDEAMSSITVTAETIPEWFVGIEDAVDKFGKSIGENGQLVSDYSDQVEKSLSSALKNVEDNMVDFITKGKADWKDFADSVVNEIVRIQVRQQIMKPLASSASSFLGGFFHAGKVGVHHAGIVPTHHNGSMRSDERMAKLQVGESVINRHGTSKNKKALEAINRGESVGGGGVVVNVENNTSQAIEAEQISSMLSTNARGEEERVVNIVIKNSQTNSNFRSALAGAIGR